MAAASVATIKSWHATRGNCLSHKRAVTDQWPPFALLFSFTSSSLLVCQMQMLGYSFSYFWNWRNRGISTEAIERRGTVTVAQHKQSSRFSLALLPSLRAVATAQLAHLLDPVASQPRGRAGESGWVWAINFNPFLLPFRASSSSPPCHTSSSSSSAFVLPHSAENNAPIHAEYSTVVWGRSKFCGTSTIESQESPDTACTQDTLIRTALVIVNN